MDGLVGYKADAFVRGARLRRGLRRGLSFLGRRRVIGRVEQLLGRRFGRGFLFLDRHPRGSEPRSWTPHPSTLRVHG